MKMYQRLLTSMIVCLLLFFSFTSSNSLAYSGTFEQDESHYKVVDITKLDKKYIDAVNSAAKKESVLVAKPLVKQILGIDISSYKPVFNTETNQLRLYKKKSAIIGVDFDDFNRINGIYFVQ
ncbi:hypothetical protein [Paenibacillus arenosi]|uniref:DUF3887 domain-containing protein n=1 Tax=Paenibacillus arenosi TaxID=2774142 RepID=A0ABR9B5M7_9BACL|nr:hypothetical protein [Paenibacillus arenosi]MBD8500481.1 hypothetical protein [Paenibacillus arenosi]